VFHGAGRGHGHAMTESAPRTPHPVEPAEGADSPGQDESGRTPHPDQPAEGTEEAAEEGLDPENRITGV
jgi:hypothetical protein